jgi:nitrous oxide reductase accessory protein NosL
MNTHENGPRTIAAALIVAVGFTLAGAAIGSGFFFSRGTDRYVTINAREAAEKFAQDSGSKVGKIRKASQGYFSISDRDRNSPDKKVVRVVTTVEYYLVD